MRLPRKGRIKYLELKQLLWLSYCQAMKLLLFIFSSLKDSPPVWDHPVIAGLVDIKILLDKEVFLFSTRSVLNLRFNVV